VLVPALVLVALALVVGGAGVLARVHRLPRNRVLGVRTPWTMSRVDTFRRANRAAAPAFVAAGVAGVVAGLAGALAPSAATAVTLTSVGAAGTVVLLAVGGVVGSRFALLDEAEVRAAQRRGDAGCCTPGWPEDPRPTAEPTAGTPDAEACAPTGCAGACDLCPRGAGAGTGSTAAATSPGSPDRP